ncbi:MAG: PspC domain-containing protein [Candidatus Marinimicrobia bacterium]|jgi:phage shock protein PspC (stress-responsive transcriptional regulator)|nr:PspC domain-containing protein [Candidatus Neomarinimicrobiota bacterium]MBT7495215.1 PspC domain-containing protein [Candidatus Neomarinimicrobiota bacterium]
MKKTQTINLGGIIFHIEVDAYDQLYTYLSSVKKQFANMDGQEEIIEDIESRIAEILNDKKVKIITNKHVNDIIAVMGKPEQYGEDDSDTKPEPIAKAKGAPRRIYRHPDDKILGGVCGGLGALVGIDPVIFRIIFMVTAFFGGFGALIYLVMWAIIPMAQSTSDRLKMAGKPITADSIGKTITAQVEKGFEPANGKNVIKKIFNFIGKIFEAVFGLLKKIFKALVIILRPIFGIVFLILGLVATLWGAFLVFGIEGMLSFVDTSHSHILDSIFSALPMSQYIIYVALALFLVIPIFQLIYFGLRLLFHMGNQPAFLKGLLTSLWVLSLISLIIFGVFGGTRYSSEGFSRRNVPLSKITADTVQVSLWENDYFLWTSRQDHTVKTADDNLLVSDVLLDIKRSDDDLFHLIVHYEAASNSSRSARGLAESISYNFLPAADGLLLKNYLKIRDDQPYAFQKVDLVLLVPEGRSVYLDESLKYMLDDVRNVTDTWDRRMVEHTWEMKKEGLTCTDCD